MPRFTFRFGEFEGDERLPPLNYFEEFAEEQGIIGPQDEQRGAYDYYYEDNFFYMEFAKEVSEEVVVLEEGSFVHDEIARARVMRFILFDDNTYGFESRRGVHDSDAFEYLLSDFDFEYILRRYDSLGLDVMREFYKQSNVVKKIKAKDIGEHEPNPHVTDRQVRELTEDFGQHSWSFVASVGRIKKNLKQAQFIRDGLAKYSGLSMIRSLTSDGSLRKLRDSGRFDFDIDSDLDDEEEARIVRDTVTNFIDNILNNEGNESEETEEQLESEDIENSDTKPADEDE